MMNQFLTVVAGLALFCVACNEKPGSTPGTTIADTSADSATRAPYFPVASFISNEIDYVDSLPVGIMKYTIKKGKTDSAYIDIKEFHRLANEFLEKEMSDSLFAKEFKEVSFLDRSTNDATFFYSTINPQLVLRRVDVITAKGNVYDEVKSIYIEKNYQQADTSTIKKMIWTPKRNFQIITITALTAEQPETEQVKVVWDNRE